MVFLTYYQKISVSLVLEGEEARLPGHSESFAGQAPGVPRSVAPDDKGQKDKWN